MTEGMIFSEKGLPPLLPTGSDGIRICSPEKRSSRLKLPDWRRSNRDAQMRRCAIGLAEQCVGGNQKELLKQSWSLMNQRFRNLDGALSFQYWAPFLLADRPFTRTCLGNSESIDLQRQHAGMYLAGSARIA
jgi:hypothetical protein